MATDIEVVVGTYEEFLLGYKIDNTGPSMQLIQSFATHAHTSSVRSVASVGKYLASGGADDKIVFHDMKTRTESRVLMHHNGTVNSVAFAEGGTHVLSASADGALTVTRTGNWQIEKHWGKAHKGSAVTYIAIHPSSKLALTIGDDHTLRTWNLVKGRQAYAINLASKGSANPLSVVWGPEGEHFSLTGYNDISVWTISNAAVKKILKCPSKSVCMVWISETLAAAGLENGDIMLFDIENEKTETFKAHTQRVKAIAYADSYVYSGSSSGHIKVWKLKPRKLKLLEKCSISTGCRITCLTLVNPFEDIIKKEEVPETEENEDSNTTKNGKRKRTESEEKESNVMSGKINKSLKPYVTVIIDGYDGVDGDGEEASNTKKATHSPNQKKKKKKYNDYQKNKNFKKPNKNFKTSKNKSVE